MTYTTYSQQITDNNTTSHKAIDYDRQVQQVIPFYASLHNETIDLVHIVNPKPSVWLDTGGGTGTLIDAALPLFPTTQFFLADPSKAMLLEAKQRFASQPENRVNVLPPMSSGELSTHFPTLCPDVITAIMSHHYLQPFDRREAVQACYHLLAPGGLFITFENIDRSTERGREIGLERWKQFQVAQGRPSDVVDQHLTRFNTKYFPITISSHLMMLKEIGFQTVEIFWHSYMQAGFYALK